MNKSEKYNNGVKKELESRLGIKLVKTYTEIGEEKSFDVEVGKGSTYYDVEDIKNKFTKKDEYPLVLGISEDGKFQFYYDATPVPTSLHTKCEAHYMGCSLNPSHKEVSDLTPKVYRSMVKTVNSWRE